MGRASFILAIFASGSTLPGPSPGSRASRPCALRSRRARSSKRGYHDAALLGQARQHPPVTLARVPPARCCATKALASHGRGIDPDALAVDQTQPRRSEPEPRRGSPCGRHGAGARGNVTARNGPAHNTGFPAVETPVATGNPSSAIPARAQSRCPRSSPPGAFRNSAPAALRRRTTKAGRVIGCDSRLGKAVETCPRAVPTSDGRYPHDSAMRGSSAQPTFKCPDDPYAVPLSSANPRSKSNVKNQISAACVQCRLCQPPVMCCTKPGPSSSTRAKSKLVDLTSSRYAVLGVVRR